MLPEIDETMLMELQKITRAFRNRERLAEKETGEAINRAELDRSIAGTVAMGYLDYLIAEAMINAGTASTIDFPFIKSIASRKFEPAIAAKTEESHGVAASKSRVRSAVTKIVPRFRSTETASKQRSQLLKSMRSRSPRMSAADLLKMMGATEVATEVAEVIEQDMAMH